MKHEDEGAHAAAPAMLRPSNVVLRSALLIGALGACNAPSEPSAVVPLAEMPKMAATETNALHGDVHEVVRAGHYTYLRVGEPHVWAVVMGAVRVPVGEAISLRVQGSQDNFHSRRLNRDFPRIFFASVENPKAPS